MRFFTWIAAILMCLSVSAQTADEALKLHENGRHYFNEGKIAEGREATRQAMNMRRELFGEVSEDYITSLNNYALSFGMEENYTKAMELQQQVMDLCGQLKKPHPKLGLFALNMGRYCYLNGNMQEAAKYCELALPLTEKFSETYELLLTILGDAYLELNDMPNMERIMVLIDEYNRHKLSKDCNEPKCMWERAQYYMSTGNTALAKEHFLKALDMPMEDELKTQVYESYAQFLFSTKDYALAAEYLQAAANSLKSWEQNKTSETYARMLHKAGIYHFLGKEYPQAVECYHDAITAYQQNDTAAGENAMKCYNDMGNAYSAQKEYGKAKECFQKVVVYYEENDRNNEDYPKALLRMAKAEKFNKEYDAAIEHHLAAMKLFEERNMPEEYTDAANSLKLCYVYAGRQDEVDFKEDIAQEMTNRRLDNMIQEELAHLELIKTYFSKLNYAQSLSTIAGCYLLKQDYANAIKYYQQYTEAVREGVRDEFRLQNKTERAATWDNGPSESVQNLEELLLTFILDKDSLTDDVATLVYDVELLSKGVLLNSAIEFKKVLENQGDTLLENIYERSEKNETEIKRLRQQAATPDDLEKLLQLTQENQQLQLELYKGCAEYADFTNYISYTWQDVQNALGEQDIAIEFVEVKGNLSDQDNYMVALLLTKERKQPTAIAVVNMEDALRMEKDEKLFEQTGNPIWGTLSSFLAGKKRIFFSADGSFNRIGIEYLLYDGRPLSEQYEVYRLSSTKELCYRHAKNEITKVALFGDINYNDATDPTTQGEHKVRGTGDIEGFANLSHTLREIDGIEEILKHKKVGHILRFTDVNAGSHAFKGLTDSDVNLLHIATHGLYREGAAATDAASMANSLLVFAGANLNDDGLVPASEVATMNLRRCDLAVLSACETGLGRLGEDGVFGLQRGFKNAGVHTLMMSLKNVYDDSTAELMISFYKHFFNGESKREALVKAQQELRDKGYKEAKYWAMFILLDAY